MRAEQNEQQQNKGALDELLEIVAKGAAVAAVVALLIFMVPAVLVFLWRVAWAEKPRFWFWGRLEPWRGLIAVVGVAACLGVVWWSVSPVVLGAVHGENVMPILTAGWFRMLIVNLVAGIGLIPAAFLVARPVVAQAVDQRRIENVEALERIERQRFVAADRKLAYAHGFSLGRDGDVRPRRKEVQRGPVEVEVKR